MLFPRLPACLPTQNQNLYHGGHRSSQRKLEIISTRRSSVFSVVNAFAFVPASLRRSAARSLPASLPAAPSRSAYAPDRPASEIPARKEFRTPSCPRPPAAEPLPHRTGRLSQPQLRVRDRLSGNRKPRTRSDR